MLRRGLALGGGLILLILIVLGVKGCLDARANEALSGYARNVKQIVEETQQTSNTFFGKLSNPGKLSVTEFVAEVNADRSAMDNYAARIDALSAPGGMGPPQDALKLVYELRASAMGTIANKVKTALGNAGSAKASAAIANQMKMLLASDQLYAAVVRPEINAVLENNGISGSEVPKSVFLPDGTKWLQESAVKTALAGVKGSNTAAATPGVHGLGLIGVAINGTKLAESGVTSVHSEGTPEVEVEVQNQGESTENGIGVKVQVEGGAEVEGSISTIPAAEIATTTIALTPAPKGEVKLLVEVEAVPGEVVTENNKATYSVVFE